jgi:hypothetical protein
MRARVLRIVATSVLAIGPQSANAGGSKVFDAQAEMWCHWMGVAKPDPVANGSDRMSWPFQCSAVRQDRTPPAPHSEGLLLQDRAPTSMRGLQQR